VITRRRLLWGASTAGLLALGGCDGTPPARLTIAAGDEAGIYIAFARRLATRLQDRVAGLQVDVLSTAGTIENIELLRSGRADLALGLADGVQGDRADRADGAPWALARTYENYLQLVVSTAGPVHSVADLSGRSISLGATGSGAAFTGTVMLDAAGLNPGAQIQHNTLSAAVDAVTHRAVDALLWSGGVPTPAISGAAGSGGVLQMIALDGVAPRMRAVSAFDYEIRRVPDVGYGPAYPGGTVGVANLLLCRPGLPSPLARQVVLALVQDARDLIPPFAQGRQYLSPPTMIQTGTVPLHPGAADAYRSLHP
jgi:TRAP transporter TAXI family solute receptor